MKRLILPAIAAIIALGLCSCGGDGIDVAKESSSVPVSSAYIYASSAETEAPKAVTIKTDDGAVTICGVVKKSGSSYSLVLESETTFEVTSGSAAGTYAGCTAISVPDGSVLDGLDGLTVTLSGSLASKGDSLQLKDAIVENVNE